MAIGNKKRYQFSETKGRGAYGKILKAYDTLLNRTVAFKQIDSDRSPPGKMLKEAQSLAQLNHPNIVTLYELVEIEGVSYIAMEFIEGETLASFIKKGLVDFEIVRSFAQKLVSALSAAHSVGIVHADIKPDNIMIDAAGDLKLLDFGLARMARQQTHTETLLTLEMSAGTISGTLPYMAPEILAGEAPTEKSDIFSLGAVLYELITGIGAFKAMTEAATLNNIMTRNFSPEMLCERGTPEAFAALVTQMLARNADQRPASMAEIGILLAETGEGAYRAKPTGWTDTARGKTAAFAVLVIVAGLFVWGALTPPEFEAPISQQIDQGLEKLKQAEEKGSIDEAVAGFQRILVSYPENAAATAGLSLALTSKYAVDEANGALLDQSNSAAQLALNLDSQLALAHTAYAWAQEFLAHHEAAIHSYQNALLRDPKDFFALEGYSRLLVTMRQYGEAEDWLLKAIEHFPDQSVFFNQLGALKYRQQDYGQAELYFEKSIALAPDNIFSYSSLSAIHYLQGDTPAAINILQQGLKIRPHPDLYSNLGTYLFSLKQYAQSVTAFEQAVALKSNSADYILWANLADAYRWTAGEDHKAAPAYLHAIAILQDQYTEAPYYHSRSALYYAKAGNVEQARTHLAHAISGGTNDALTLFRATVTAELLGARKEALGYLEAALEAGLPKKLFLEEPELQRLRSDERFRNLILIESQLRE